MDQRSLRAINCNWTFKDMNPGIEKKSHSIHIYPTHPLGQDMT